VLTEPVFVLILTESDDIDALELIEAVLDFTLKKLQDTVALVLIVLDADLILIDPQLTEALVEIDAVTSSSSPAVAAIVEDTETLASTGETVKVSKLSKFPNTDNESRLEPKSSNCSKFNLLNSSLSRTESESRLPDILSI
jgi:hypothetical protein